MNIDALSYNSMTIHDYNRQVWMLRYLSVDKANAIDTAVLILRQQKLRTAR